MTRYRYQAVNEANEPVSGVIEAATVRDAARRLTAVGHVPLHIGASKPESGLSAFRPLAPGRRGLSFRDAGRLIARLGELVEAGIPADRALAILSDGPRSRAVDAAARMRRFVLRGGTMSEAMRSAMPRLPAHLAGIVEAGEKGGRLGAVLKAVSLSIARTDQMRSRIATALLYPAILFLLIVFTISLVFGLVLPEFRRVFESAHVPLPAATRALLVIGDAFSAYWPFLAFFLACLALLALWAWRTPEQREKIDRRLLTLPGISGFERLSFTAEFAGVAHLLLEQGFTLSEAVRLARASVHNRAASRDLEAALVKLNEGMRFSDVLAQIAAFDRGARALVLVGEETGQLAAMLAGARAHAERDFDQAVERFNTLLTPAMTIVMGFVVGAVMVSLLSGIMALTQIG